MAVSRTLSVSQTAAAAAAGYEVFASDGSRSAFRTPLATLHRFQGWTDKFLGTPPAGVEDA